MAATSDSVPPLVVVPRYSLPPNTIEPLDYATLAIIDLSKGNTAEGKAALAHLVYSALSTQGFFYVVNHGLSLEEVQRVFDIADVPFSQVSEDEKRRYEGSMKQSGSWQGYKLRQYWSFNGVPDQVENYATHRDTSKREHPDALRPYLPEIQAFAHHNHRHVLYQVLRLLSLGLGLNEDAFVDLHGYEAVSESFVRFMKYHPRTEREEEESAGVWLKGHTDFGTITLVYSQPVAALQILQHNADGTRTWKWVQHIENALIVNGGDALQFLSGGRYKAAIHRVVQPPLDQRQYTRLSVFYFALANDDVVLKPLPGLKVVEDSDTVNSTEYPEKRNHPTMVEWRRGRTSAFGRSQLAQGKDSGVEEETIHDVTVKHYN